MLVVKDFALLEAHGFKKADMFDNTWTKKIEPRDASTSDSYLVELVVNPLSDECAENEVLLYVYADLSDKHGRNEVDLLLDCEEVFALIAAGVLEYKKGCRNGQTESI